MKKAAGMRAVAVHLGVSLMTVSLALRHDRRIPPRTRARVEAAARELGYEPDPRLASLMSYLRRRGPATQRGVLAWINPYEDRGLLWDTPSFRLFFEGAAERATLLGYKLEEFWLRAPGMNGARLSRILHARGVPGLILAPRRTQDPPPDLDWSAFACAVVGSTRYTPNLHRVCNHQFQGMMLALQTLRQQGWTSIGVALQRKPAEVSDNSLFAAFAVFRESHAHDLRLSAFYAQEFTEVGFAEWVSEYRPEVVVSLHPPVRAWLKRLPRALARGVGYVNLDLASPAQGVAGIDQHSRLVGAGAVDIVVQQVHADERGVPDRHRLLLIEGSWTPGRSARPRIRR